MGAILREQNALPYGYLNICYSLAKDDVDNVGAGRAAKGATPTSFYDELSSGQARVRRVV